VEYPAGAVTSCRRTIDDRGNRSRRPRAWRRFTEFARVGLGQVARYGPRAHPSLGAVAGHQMPVVSVGDQVGLSRSLRSVLAGPVAGQPHFDQCARGPTPTRSRSRAPKRGACLRPLARAAGAVLALRALVTAVGSAQAGAPSARFVRAGVESGAAPSGATRDTTLRSGRTELLHAAVRSPNSSRDRRGSCAARVARECEIVYAPRAWGRLCSDRIGTGPSCSPRP
jgi:hypothetical protein